MNNETIIKLPKQVEEITSQLDNIEQKKADKIIVDDIDGRKADKNTIWSMASMGQDVKEAMTGGSVAIVGKNTVLTENIVDKQVTIKKLDRLYADGVVGKNKFNKNDVKNGYYIDPTNGIDVSSSGNSVSDFIEVDNVPYYFSNLFTGARYDSNYQFIDGTANVENWNSTPMPNNVKYVRVSCINTRLNNAQIEVGTKPTSYEEYKHYAKNIYVIDNSITPNKLDRIYADGVKGKNLFDKSQHKLGYIDPSNGNIESSLDNFYIEMEIESGKYYAYSNFQLGAYLDVNKNFINGTPDISSNWNGNLPPANARYIRVSSNISKLNIAQIEEGIAPTSYEEYGFYPKRDKSIKINKIKVPSSVPTITQANNSIVDSDYYNRYIIELDNGTYAEKDIYLKPFVYLEGKDRDKTIIKGELPSSATDEQITPSSTINLIHSNGLKNLTVTCKNMRYPIHDDGGGVDKERVVENCKFIHYGNDEARAYRQEHGLGGTVWESENAYGSGINSGDDFRFKNCKFIGTINAWGTHNNIGYEKSAYIEHDNCEFIVTKDGANAMGIASMGSGNLDKIVFKGCSANAPIKYFTMGTDINSMPKKSEFEITGYGNNIPCVNEIYDDLYTPVFKDECIKLTAKENILRGQVCCYTVDFKHIKKMLPTDDISLFVGVAIEDIPIGKEGYVKNKGYVENRIINVSNSGFGKKYEVGSNATLLEGSNKPLLISVGYNQLKFI